MDEKTKIEELIDAWRKRGISAAYSADKEQARQALLKMIPPGANVGISGSQTLTQLGIIKELESRGNKVYNQYKQGLSREDSLKARREGVSADCYLTSANAISASGELVFFSAYGHRTAGICVNPNTIVVAGVNKVCGSLEQALKRSREHVTPMNCRRLGWESACLSDGICRKNICFYPEYRRMCAQVLVIEAEVIDSRLKVLLVGVELGY